MAPSLRIALSRNSPGGSKLSRVSSSPNSRSSVLFCSTAIAPLPRPVTLIERYPLVVPFGNRPSPMLFRQIIHEDLGCASYLVGDTASGVAAVVDPQWDIEPYLDLARLHGVRIEHVLETHNHADHVSGHGRLARATGATLHIHQLAEATYPHESLEDG